MKYDIRQINIAKGTALLLQLWHHLFYRSPEYYGLFTSVRVIDGIPLESYIARYCKVCVALFFFLSAYGMFKSLQKNSRRDPQGGAAAQVRFVWRHLVRLLMDFWYIYLIFVPLGICFGVYFWEVYQGNVLYGLYDFFCLSFFTRTPSMNSSWWYMSMILAFYLLLPLLGKLTEVCPAVAVAAALFFMLVPKGFFPRDVSRITEWLAPILSGMLFARFDCFERIGRCVPRRWQGLLLTVPAVAFFAYHRFKAGESVRFDALFALSILLFCYLVLSRIPGLSRVLAWVGGYSGPIYMFHTFVFLLYGKPFIYWFRYPVLIYAVMLALCLLIAVGLRYLKKLIRYDRLTKRLSGQ